MFRNGMSSNSSRKQKKKEKVLTYQATEPLDAFLIRQPDELKPFYNNNIDYISDKRSFLGLHDSRLKNK